MYFWKWYVTNVKGIELSHWAVQHPLATGIIEGNIVDGVLYEDVDLITAVDVLEHLSDLDLSQVLQNMAHHGKHFLFSIPFVGDPNLTNDGTHKQFKTKDEWKQLIDKHGIKVQDAPVEWHYSHQLLIGVKS